MKIPFLLLIAGLSLALCACASSKKEEPNPEAAERAIPPPAIAPGTANASAQVLGYDEEDTYYVCTLKIQQVNEYGASTPPLPVGTEIEVVMPKTLFGEDPDGSKAAAMLTTDQTLNVSLRHQEVPKIGDQPAHAWRVVEIH